MNLVVTYSQNVSQNFLGKGENGVKQIGAANTVPIAKFADFRRGADNRI